MLRNRVAESIYTSQNAQFGLAMFELNDFYSFRRPILREKN